MSSSARLFAAITISIALVVSLWIADAEAASGCTATIVSLAPCLEYTTGSATQPTRACCTSLAGVVNSKPQCLCSLVDGAGGSQFNVNETLALLLPKACNVDTPPISECKSVVNGTTTSAPPSTSSKADPPTSTKAPATPTPKDGSKEAPSPPDNSKQSSGGVKMAGSLFLLIITFAASYAPMMLEM